MKKPKTIVGDLAHLPAALAPMIALDHWLLWRWEFRRGIWTKPPYVAASPTARAKNNDPATWRPYKAAVTAVQNGSGFDGIGFALLDTPFDVVDLDRCLNPATGQPDTWAEIWLEQANGAYIERTPSGEGLRIIGKADTGEKLHRKWSVKDAREKAAIEVYRNCERYITVTGAQVGDCKELAQVDLLEKIKAHYDGARTDRSEKKNGSSRGGFDFNDAYQQSSSIDYDDVIKNGASQGERSELFQAVIWHLANMGRTPEQITDELSQHPNGIGAKYADRLHAEVERSYQKWQSCVRAGVTGSATSTVNDPWPQIRVIPGELPRVVNEAEDALLLLGREIYQRGGLVVRPVKSKLKAADNRDMTGWQLIPVVRPYMVEALCCAARFLRYDGRTKNFVAINAPDNVADAYLARRGQWKLPVLTGIIHTPFLRADGSIGGQDTYDAETGLLFKPDGQTFPLIPQQPSKDDAADALAELDNLIDTFPFVTPADRSVALSAILTILDRRSMATAPLHAFTAPVAGTGKSLLVDLAAILATGQPMPVISPGRSEEELEKRLGAALLAGDVGISIDNCEHELASTFLCQALTQSKLNIRVLGQSRNVETPVNATIFATGNNLVIAGDLTRRSLLCSLDAGCEHPEQRSFNTDIVEFARQRRDRLVAAALTVLRAWHVAGEAPQAKPLGSFEDWSYRVREPLLWLGQADPCQTTSKIKFSDPTRGALQTVLEQWRENLGLDTGYTVQEIISRSINVSDFHVALMNVASGRSGNVVSNERLGRWLKRIEGRIAIGLTVKQAGMMHGYPIWRLTAC